MALAVAVVAGCVPAPRQPPATDTAILRVAAAARRDIYGRPVELRSQLAGRALLYFFRTDCAHCASAIAAAPGLAARPGVALVLISRESPERLRAVFGPAPRPGLTLVSDGGGAIMDSALRTLYVPRVVGVESFAVRLDVTGGGLRLADAAAFLVRERP